MAIAWRLGIGLLALLCLTPLLGQAAPGAAPLPAFSAQYTLTRNGMTIGETRVSLSGHTDGTFIYETRTSPVGILAWLTGARVWERSLWTVQGNAPRPLAYDYQREIGNTKRSVQLVFNWDQGVVRNNIEGKVSDLQVPNDTLDKLLVQLALMLDLREPSQPLEYHIADDGKLKTYRFRIVGRERITTAMGTFDTLKVERRHETRERSTVLWCAPELRYLPVRVDQHERGANYSMSIQSLQGLGDRPAA